MSTALHWAKPGTVALMAMLALGQAGSPGQEWTAGRISPERFFRWERVVRVPPGGSGPACAVLDAAVYAHGQGESLNDLRLFASGSEAETPFTLTESNTEHTESEAADVRNVRMEGQGIGFDLLMPKRPYTAVKLLLHAKDFIGSAAVLGRDAQGHAVALGEFALFDLSAQHLPRSTTLPLQESSFAELHIVLRLHAAPGSVQETLESGIVRGASVPPSRAAQTVFTPVAETSTWTQRGQNSVATVRLPPYVPVARVRFSLAPGFRANFRRDVTIAAKPGRWDKVDSAEPDVDTVGGEISQVHLPQAQSRAADARSPNQPGLPIDSQQMDVDAVLAANLRGGATVELAVANGTDPPLPLQTVQLEMRERRICFEANASVREYTLMYGGKGLKAAVYNRSRELGGAETPLHATLGPEQPNPGFAPGVDVPPFAARHPDLLWLGLLGALAGVGGVAMRGVRHRRGGLR